MWVGTRTFRNRITSPFDFWTRTQSCLLVVFCVLLAGAARPASAQTALANLHNFGLPPDGEYPEGPLALVSDGTFVGTTLVGGTNGSGSIYDISTSGAETVIYSFSALDSTSFTNNDGAEPLYGVTVGGDGNYYGCTLVGGTNGFGTAFMVTPAGVFTTLHNFTSTDGANPVGLTESSTANTFYGTCESGGDNNSGTIFKMVVLNGAGTITTLHSFAAMDANGNNTDGADPQVGPIIAKDGNLYGTTLEGGNSGSGLSDGIVGGTIWTYSLATTTTSTTPFQVLHTFSALDANLFNTDGTRPDAALVQITDGSFIGSCEDGGTAGAGTVFDITASGTYTVLHQFAAVDTLTFTNADGFGPSAGVVQLTDGSIYGTCEGGGVDGLGTVFKIATPTATPSFSVVYTFGSQSSSVQDGSLAEGNLIEGKDGNVYGTTAAGGVDQGASSFGAGGIFFELPLSLPAPDPGLTVTKLSTASAQAGSPGFILTVTGTKFDATSVVNWQLTGNTTQALTTTFVSATKLTALISTPLLGEDANLNAGIPETHNITVVNTVAATGVKTTSSATAASMFTVNPSVTVPPAITQITPASITAGSGATTIVVTGTNLFTGDDVEVNGTVLTPTQVTTTRATVTVPASLLTKAGTLTVTASSNAGPSNALGLTVTPVTTYPAGLQFISEPYDYPGIALSSIFGYANPKLAVWNTATSAYAISPNAPANAVRLGRGYWVRFPASAGVVISGTPATVGQPFTISLLKGWNMIGDPFLTTVPGTGVTVVDSHKTSYTFADAATANIIDANTYYYDASIHQYLTQGTGAMQPFVGYWIYASAPCTLLLNGS